MFPLFSLFLSIFVTYPKEKMKENDFFFFEKFGYAWGTHAEVPQEYKYLKKYLIQIQFHFWSTRASLV